MNILLIVFFVKRLVTGLQCQRTIFRSEKNISRIAQLITDLSSSPSTARLLTTRDQEHTRKLRMRMKIGNIPWTEVASRLAVQGCGNVIYSCEFHQPRGRETLLTMIGLASTFTRLSPMSMASDRIHTDISTQ